MSSLISCFDFIYEKEKNFKIFSKNSLSFKSNATHLSIYNKKLSPKT